MSRDAQRVMLRLSNYSLGLTLAILVVNSAVFCKVRGYCKGPPTRSTLGASSLGIVANTEIAFITLLSAQAAFSLLLRILILGRSDTSVNVPTAFLLPVVVAICFTFDLRRFRDVHIALATLIIALVAVLMSESTTPLLVFAALAILRLELQNRYREVADGHRLKKTVKAAHKSTEISACKTILNGIIQFVFSAGVFFPVFHIMHLNHKLENTL
jgi:hypothetical protein